NLGETTTSGERRSPVRSPDNDDDNMDFQYNHEDNDLSFQDINDDDNEYGSIGP
ncbi:6393_t:CDS:1, partial [Rhizophagus irregularis]